MVVTQQASDGRQQAHPTQELRLEAQLIGLEVKEGCLHTGGGLPEENKQGRQQDAPLVDGTPQLFHLSPHLLRNVACTQCSNVAAPFC